MAYVFPSHGFLATSTNTKYGLPPGKQFLNPIRKWLVTTVTFMLLLQPWEYLSKPVIIVALSVHSWARL